MIFLYWQNNSVELTKMNISSDDLPSEFHEYRIIQLSDLHSKSFGENQNIVIDQVEKTNPDLIVFTGDLVDQKKYNEKTSLSLMKELLQTAPVIFVTGNHEWWSGEFNELEKKLMNQGVTVLRNDSMNIEKGDAKIIIHGVDDPAGGTPLEDNVALVSTGISDEFNILLSHRPEYFSLYEEFHFDLIFSGHAHGGQFRLPFLGGIVAPDQGLLPEYDAGRFESGNSVMIVNRGLGNSIIPQRIFNRPEIIQVTLFSKGCFHKDCGW
ncbi:MAG: metallophosphoesterase [Bacillota bacterium]